MLTIQYNKNSISLQGEGEDLLAAHCKRFGLPKLEILGYDINSLHVQYPDKLLLITSVGHEEQGEQCNHERHASCYSVFNSVILLWPGVFCLLSRSIQLWHATLLACKWGKTLDLSKFMTEIKQLDEEFQQKAGNYYKMEILELEIK